MKADCHCMPAACPEASPRVQLVQIEVSPAHPLLVLKRALPWEAITEAMTRHWREHGKNVDGGPGWPGGDVHVMLANSFHAMVAQIVDSTPGAHHG